MDLWRDILILLSDKDNISENNKFKTVCAMGLFDGVHLGHRLVIEKAVRLKNESGGRLKAAVFTFETSSLTSKGRLEMLLSDEQKRQHIEKLGADYLYSPDFSMFKDMPAEDFVRLVLKEKLGCAAAVCGADFSFGRKAEGNVEVLRELGKKYGIEVYALDKLSVDGTEVSSTAIREYIKSGEIGKANALLGYQFGYTQTVRHGNELGRTWNFPTINQKIPESSVLPKFGVYCSRVKIGEETYFGVTNIGIKPTVQSGLSPLAETYILDFSGDLYGRTVTLYPEYFVRVERKFESFDKLKEQIAADTEFTARYYKAEK